MARMAHWLFAVMAGATWCVRANRWRRPLPREGGTQRHRQGARRAKVRAHATIYPMRIGGVS